MRRTRPLCFFFNDTATTEIYTLSLHDALPISGSLGDDRGVGSRPGLRESPERPVRDLGGRGEGSLRALQRARPGDRKSTRLNSSHANISYAVFCLKKKIQPRPGTQCRKPYVLP